MAWFGKKQPEEDNKEAAPQTGGFMEGFKKSLSKTREVLTTPIDELFAQSTAIDEDFLDNLEETLITADIGVSTTMMIMDKLRERLNTEEIETTTDLKKALSQEILCLMENTPAPGEISDAKPCVIMVAGVNGVGKTTTIGKIAALFSREGKKVLVVAGDTFRAAAVEQLEIWAERADVQIVRHSKTTDPAAVVFDGIEAAVAREMDVVLIDTAGRLHTQVNLMEELKKIKRAAAKKLSGAPHDVWLVIDASTGQNAITQAKMFHEALGLTGLVLTKLDGTAKGGVILAIAHELDIPLLYVGTGEKINDISKFDRDTFVNALF